MNENKLVQNGIYIDDPIRYATELRNFGSVDAFIDEYNKLKDAAKKEIDDNKINNNEFINFAKSVTENLAKYEEVVNNDKNYSYSDPAKISELENSIKEIKSRFSFYDEYNLAKGEKNELENDFVDLKKQLIELKHDNDKSKEEKTILAAELASKYDELTDKLNNAKEKYNNSKKDFAKSVKDIGIEEYKNQISSEINALNNCYKTLALEDSSRDTLSTITQEMSLEVEMLGYTLDQGNAEKEFKDFCAIYGVNGTIADSPIIEKDEKIEEVKEEKVNDSDETEKIVETKEGEEKTGDIFSSVVNEPLDNIPDFFSELTDSNGIGTEATEDSEKTSSEETIEEPVVPEEVIPYGGEEPTDTNTDSLVEGTDTGLKNEVESFVATPPVTNEIPDEELKTGFSAFANNIADSLTETSEVPEALDNPFVSKVNNIGDNLAEPETLTESVEELKEEEKETVERDYSSTTKFKNGRKKVEHQQKSSGNKVLMTLITGASITALAVGYGVESIGDNLSNAYSNLSKKVHQVGEGFLDSINNMPYEDNPSVSPLEKLSNLKNVGQDLTNKFLKIQKGKTYMSVPQNDDLENQFRGGAR